MVRLTENAGYGFDKIETNWEQYNHTAPEYDISFDATILKLYTQKEGARAKTSKKFQEELKNKPANIDLIIRLLADNYENFKIYITENFGVSSGTLRKHFGDTSETKKWYCYYLIISNKDITAKEAAKVIGVSDRTIETYFTKLKSKNIIERIGSATFGGYWTLKKD